MIMALNRQGLSPTAIARQPHIDRKTVCQYIPLGLEPPIEIGILRCGVLASKPRSGTNTDAGANKDRLIATFVVPPLYSFRATRNPWVGYRTSAS